MAIEIVDFPMKNGWIFNSYVKLPEDNPGISSGKHTKSELEAMAQSK